jgi:choline kinase
MRYLILAAGMGRRLGDASAGAPKCLVDIGGEPLIGRLLRQIRTLDADADLSVVVGYRREAVIPVAAGCRIVVNPDYDVTGIDVSLWHARAAFDQPVMVIHGDLVLADALVAALLSEPAPTFMGYDSTLRDPAEINVAVDGGRVTRFDENFAGYSGLYAGVLRLSAKAAAVFAQALDGRIRQRASDPLGYYFSAARAVIDDRRMTVAAVDFAGQAWQEIDRPEHLQAARSRFGGTSISDAA